MTPPVSAFLSAEFSAIAHTTEDIQKVEKCVTFVVESISGTKANLSRRYLKGHHGNIITTISARLSHKELPSDTLNVLSRKLSESDRRFLSQHLGDRVDENGNLYLRFDKQEAFLGNVRLQNGDPIRMKLKFAPGYDVEAVVTLCRESGLVP